MLYVTYQDHSCHNDPALYRSNVNWFHQLQLADMKINWRVYLYQLCLTQINDHTEIADSIYPAVRGASFSNISTLDLNVRQLRRSLQIIQVLPPIPPPYSRRAFPEFSFRKCKHFHQFFPHPDLSRNTNIRRIHGYFSGPYLLFTALIVLILFLWGLLGITYSQVQQNLRESQPRSFSTLLRDFNSLMSEIESDQGNILASRSMLASHDGMN